MVDWNDGKPNARFWVLKLLRDNFGPGDKIVEIPDDNPYVYALAFSTHDGKRRVLLINKRDRKFEVSVAGAAAGQISFVDQTTNFQPPATAKLSSDSVTLGGYSVAVVSLP
jgi:hypothetical protein